MGIQFHVYDDYLNDFSQSDIAAMIKRFGDLGLQVHITEIDVAAKGAFNAGHQAAVYTAALQACVFDNPGVCTAFLSWGVTDKYTWRGTNVHPLPFDEWYNPKCAYNRMLNTLNNHGMSDANIDLFLQ